MRKPEHTAKVPSISTGNSAATTCTGNGRGRSAPTLKLLALLALTLAALFAIAAPSALAARGHVYDPTAPKIGKPCTELVCGPEELTEPSGVAVNEATGDIYVVDPGNHRVQAFSPAGAFLFMFGGGVNKTAVETPGRESEEDTCPAAGHPNDECKPGTEGAAGGAAFDEQLGGIAVDNACNLQGKSGLECPGFDPSDGDIYVEEENPADEAGAIAKFSAGGEYLGRITEGPEGPFAQKLGGVAVGPQGRLWVLQRNRVLTSYSNQEPNVYVGPQVVAETEGRFPKGGLAIDAEGNFYVRVLDHEYEIGKFSPAGHLLIEKLGPGEATGVAADPAGGSTLIDAATTLGAFNAEGDEIEHFGFGGELHEGAGIGIDSASGYAYVADSSAGHLLVLAPTQPGPPLVEAAGQYVSGVGSGEAELHSEVNPQSEEGEEATTWAFRYGPCPSLGLCPTSPFPSATPAGTLPADFASHPVAAALTGLQPGTTYHFRVVAHNSFGEGIPGAEGTFTTEVLGGELLLPDGRAWEMVTPAQKLGALIEPIAENGIPEAAADGSAITYLTASPTESDPAGYAGFEQVLARRGASAWSSQDITIPHATTTGVGVGEFPEDKFFTPDLTAAAVQPFGPFDPQLSPEASESTAFRDDLTGSCSGSCLTPLVTGAPGFANVPSGTEFGEAERCRPKGVGQGTTGIFCGPRFLGASEDLDHIVLSSEAPLTPGAGESQFYEWDEGALTQISVLPGGGSAPVTGLGLGNLGSYRGAISADGSRVFWTTELVSVSSLFIRDTEPGHEQTLQIDAAEQGCLEAGECESGGGVFQFASADGSRVFFTDTHRLTADSGAEPGGIKPKADLYECRIVETGGELACHLTDLTPLRGGESADLLPTGLLLGGSTDGSSVDFVADGVLTESANEAGASAVSGEPNLYLDQEGRIVFVATLSSGDELDWGILDTTREAQFSQPTRVSPDGDWLEFMSQASPTGYDNRDAATGAPVAEVYLYDAATGALRCASCLPSGARPTGVEYAKIEPPVGLVGGPRDIWPEPELVAANVPGWTVAEADPPKTFYQPRYLSDSGRLFFDSLDPLVPQDSDGTQDVYEYEPPGVGGCTEAGETYSARSGGCVSLISSGTSGQESAFLDASESGDDVFFLTSARLSAEDTDAARDIYDAHICSTASPCLPEPAAAPEPCKGEACQSPAPAPAVASPTSQSFAGPGNVVECRKGQVRKSGKCVKRHHKKNKKKHHKKSKKKGNNKSKKQKRAGSEHGGQK